MKTSKLLKATLFILSLSMMLFVVSCDGDDGPMGPEGPVGEQGVKGEQGPIGIPGKDGAVIFSGSGAPTASIGNTGDMYLDISTSNLYGPRTDSDWGTPLNLKGQQGSTGEKGEKGDTGDKGEKGDTGDTGAKGEQGEKGEKGDTGTAGPKGDTGDTGAKGDKGDTGDKGEKGEKGDTGAAGTPGSKILSGAEDPSSATGAIGDYYLNTTSGDFFGPKTSSGWNKAINLKGTSRVVASKWIDYDWNSKDTDTVKEMEYIIPNPFFAELGIDDLYKVLNVYGGIILIYGKNYGNPDVKLFDYEVDRGLGTRSYKAITHPIWNKIYIELTRLDGLTLQPSDYDSNNGNQFRFVLITPDVLLSGNSATSRSTSDIDWAKLSYEEVVELLQLDN